uniref:Uncharacterized protein n=1 Tax=Arundo donax TaxID=35708 RepID=A0A0A9F9N9_ARUDO
MVQTRWRTGQWRYRSGPAVQRTASEGCAWWA